MMTAPAFRKRLENMGFESKRGTGGAYSWRGIMLIQATPEGDDSEGR